MENLIGKKFNKLTVIDGPIRKKNKIYWTCQCECGNIKDIRSDGLKNGSTKSCGCYKIEKFIEANKKRQTLDLTNQRFGKLIALKLDPVKRTPDGRRVWLCQCDCGNNCYVDTHSLQEGKKSSCGCLISKGEFIIEQLLKKHNIPYEKQKTFIDCRFEDTNYLARFDFWVDNKYLIEYDGEQHFYYKDNPHTWNTKMNFEITKAHDNYKNQWCQEHHIPIIRIPYTKINNITINDLIL
ncbi:MAG: hypothetical protein K5765_07930 [Clostridia bacterium]|nr:hypothetical protein [Clostridia bacterium]